MKALGVIQFQAKKFKFLGFEGTWLEHIGNLAINFVGIIYGCSGHGKTEYCIRLAKYLCKFGKVAWLSYEQGHDSDFQMAINRNKMEEVAGIFLPIDPLKKRKPGKTLFEELDEYLGKKGTPPFIFIDSLDYLVMYAGFTLEQYFFLKEKYGGRKGIIFISHEKNGTPATTVGQKIEYDGKFSVFVKKFIARKKKNRIGGRTDYYIWEEEARRLDKLYFKLKDAEQ